jgi:hypothetical protein
MRYRGFLVAGLVVLAAAVWFGVRLGPRPGQAQPQAPTQTTALYAAQLTITRAVESKGGRVVRFDDGAASDQIKPDRWQASGTATTEMPDRVGPQRIQWKTVQEWNPERRTWRAKEVVITRPV